MADDIIESIKARVSCVRAAEALGIRMARGPQHMARRRAHCWNGAAHKNGDRNPSLALGPLGWRCYGCGEAGDVFGLWQSVRRVDFKTALDDLSRLAGVERERRGAGQWRSPARATAIPQTQQRPVDVISVPAVRAEIGARLWQLVEPLDLTPGACRWLRARGIRPEAAHALGCRDWRPVADEVRAVLSGYGEACVEAGFASWHETAVTRECKAWPQLREALSADEARHGLMVPEWHPAHPDGPVSWRLRPYHPWGKRKAEAQPGSALRHLPLGLDVLAAAATSGDPFVVVVCEGETDWLAAFDAASTLLERSPGAPYVVPIGYCLMPVKWPELPGLADVLSLASRVVIGFDRGHGDEPNGLKRARDIRDSIDRAAGAERTNAILKAHLTREGRDLADLHAAGELVDWLAGRLEV